VYFVNVLVTNPRIRPAQSDLIQSLSTVLYRPLFESYLGYSTPLSESLGLFELSHFLVYSLVIGSEN